MKSDKYLTDAEKRLYSGAWVDDQAAADKQVTCIRCFSVYHLKSAPRSVPSSDGYYIKEPHCPTCKCRWYFSHL